MPRPKARVIQAAQAAPVFSKTGALRWAGGSGNLGAPPSAVLEAVMPRPQTAATTSAVTTGPMLEPPPDDSVGDDAWARTVAAREAAQGIRTPAAPRVQHADPVGALGGPMTYVADGVPLPLPRDPTDLSLLPDRFTLDIERKLDGWWVVRAPAVHIGLFVAAQDLADALARAPDDLAAIVRLDGVVPAVEKKKRKVRDA